MTAGNWGGWEHLTLVAGTFTGSLGEKRAGRERVVASGRGAGSPPSIHSILSQGTGKVAWGWWER